MQEVEFAIINSLPDKLFLNIKIYIDPLVLDANGSSIKNGNKPVEIALDEFLKELPFNGELILQSLVDKTQKIESVKIAHIVEIKSSFLDATKRTYATPSLINVKRIFESGYFEIINFKNIRYVV